MRERELKISAAELLRVLGCDPTTTRILGVWWARDAPHDIEVTVGEIGVPELPTFRRPGSTRDELPGWATR